MKIDKSIKAAAVLALSAALVSVSCRAASAAGAVECANLANYAGRDHLGRELVSAAETGGEKGRQVGLFYYLWHGQHGTQGPYDISKMEAIDPKVMEKPDSPLWPDPSHSPMLHWGEPLFGYYLSTDEWVLRGTRRSPTTTDWATSRTCRRPRWRDNFCNFSSNLMNSK